MLTHRTLAPDMSSAAPAVQPTAAAYRVLFVDLDGSLLATDVTMESFFRAVKLRPAVILQAPVWFVERRPAVGEAAAIGNRPA